MLPLNHRIAFGLFALITLALGARGFLRLYRRIARGRRDPEQRSDRPIQRLWYALKTTLLQKRVFRHRRVLSVFHSFIFYAFVLYVVVNLVDALEGYVDIKPILPLAFLHLYGAVTDAFSFLAIVGVLVFVVRRLLPGSRTDFAFNQRTLLHDKVRHGYIRRDSLIVSVFILFHVGSRIIGNAALLATQGGASDQPVSSSLALLFAGPHAMAWRIFGYWGALGSVLLFLTYFPYSKHFHLFAAPVKYFFSRHATTGQIPPAHIDLEAAEPQVGAAFLADLSQPRLLDAYACIQCNRCQDVCPASQTGKALSPAALEINKRMVLNSLTEEVSAFSLTGNTLFERGTSSGPSLLEAVISPEALWACTTCGACMEVCPTQDEQMLDILDIRRNLVMQQGEFPTQLQSAFRGMERSSNPWGISRDKRMAWADGLDVPTIDDRPDPDVLYWVGCAASYDASAGNTARAVVQLLAEAKVNFAVLGKRECCTGDSARRAGNELLYQQMAGEAITVLQAARPRLVLASCPHCVNTISTEYSQFGGHFTVMHHTEYFAALVDQGLLKPLASESQITFHDPCYLGRHRGTYDAPRSLLNVLTDDYIDLPRSKSNGFCCGAGGAQFWKEEEPGTERISENRFREVESTLKAPSKNKILAVGCPFCKSMLQSTPAAGLAPEIAIKDVAELLWEGVQRATGPVGRIIAASLPKQSEMLVPAAQAGAPQIPTSNSGVPPQTEAPTAELAPCPASGQPLTPERAEAGISAELDAEPGTPKAPERKKWSPKAKDPVSKQERATASVVPDAPSDLVQGQEQKIEAVPLERNTWVPRAQPPKTSDETKPDRELTDAETVEPVTPRVRRKWQPGGPR